MKKLILTCAILASATFVSLAQNAHTAQNTNAAQANSSVAVNKVTPEQLADRRAKVYQKQLGLTEEQTKKSHDIEMGFAAQELAYRNQGMSVDKGAMMQMNMAKDQQYKAMLTPDQYTKFQAGRPKYNAGGGEVAPASQANHKN